MSVTQFRLSNGDEIICEVIDEPTGDDVNLVVRNAMQIVVMDVSPNTRFFSFRPWMVYQLDSNYMQLLNYTHIVGEAKPDPMMQEQYTKAITIEQSSKRETRSDIDKRLQEVMDELDGIERDSSNSNVIQFSFVDKDKLH